MMLNELFCVAQSLPEKAKTELYTKKKENITLSLEKAGQQKLKGKDSRVQTEKTVRKFSFNLLSASDIFLIFILSIFRVLASLYGIDRNFFGLIVTK